MNKKDLPTNKSYSVAGTIGCLIAVISGAIMFFFGMTISFGGDAYTYIVRGIFFGFGLLLVSYGLISYAKLEGTVNIEDIKHSIAATNTTGPEVNDNSVTIDEEEKSSEQDNIVEFSEPESKKDDNLRKATELLESGIISEEEFNTIKQSLGV